MVERLQVVRPHPDLVPSAKLHLPAAGVSVNSVPCWPLCWASCLSECTFTSKCKDLNTSARKEMEIRNRLARLMIVMYLDREPQQARLPTGFEYVWSMVQGKPITSRPVPDPSHDVDVHQHMASRTDFCEKIHATSIHGSAVSHALGESGSTMSAIIRDKGTSP